MPADIVGMHVSEKDENEVIAANAAFYAAFRARDVAAMDALWAREHPVACLHPGWDALRSREEVMKSWRAIMENRSAPKVDFLNPKAWLLGEAAFVIGYERISGTTLVVTNTFVREDGAWKIVHHHASAVHGEIEDEEDEKDEPEKEEEPDRRTLN